MPRKTWLDQHQKGASILMLVLGIFFAHGIIFAPLHEWGHFHWATRIEKIGARIVDWNHTEVEKLTPHVLLAGYRNEVMTFLIIYAILFLISSPDSINFRRYWFHIGFPLGYASWSWLRPLLFPVSDFTIIPEWTAGLRGSFFSDYIIVMPIAWLAFVFLRFRRSKLL